MDKLISILENIVAPTVIGAVALTLFLMGWEMSWLEITGVMLSLFSVILIKKQLLVGPVMVWVAQIILMIFYLQNDLYSAFFFALATCSIYVITFINWIRPRKNAQGLRPSFLDWRLFWLITAGGAAIFLFRMHTGFIGSIEFLAPYFVFMGHFLLISKFNQGWIFLVISWVVMSILMFTIGGYVLFTRNVFLMIIAPLAYIKWRREIKEG